MHQRKRAGGQAPTLTKNTDGLTRFGNTADRYIDFGNLIPGRIVYNAGLGQIEDTLEGTDGIGSGRAVDAIGSNPGNSRVVLGNPV